MTEPPLPENEGDDEAVASLVRKAMQDAPFEGGRAPNLLPEVQRKLRQRSRGKFFADGWSTTSLRASPALIALTMLLLVVVAYLAMGPMGLR